MGEKISIAYQVNASAGAEGKTSIYTVPAPRNFVLREVLIHFPSGTDGDLKLAFYIGDFKVLPREGYYTGDGGMLKDDSDATFNAGEDITLYYKNENATEAKKAYILIMGELV